MASVYTSIRDKKKFLDELNENLLNDLDESFPGCLGKKDNTVGKALMRINEILNERFVFLIDE